MTSNGNIMPNNIHIPYGVLVNVSSTHVTAYAFHPYDNLSLSAFPQVHGTSMDNQGQQTTDAKHNSDFC